MTNKKNGQPVFRAVRALSAIVKRRNLRIAGLAETNRLRMEWTLQMVEG